MTSVLEVKDLVIGYDNHLAVDKISFDVQEGDVLGIVGPNGAGKTTLFRAILGLQKYSGKIKMFGLEDSKYHSIIPLIGYVPQKVIFEPNFPATVFDVVSMGIIPNKKLLKGAKIVQQCGCCWNRFYSDLGSNYKKVMGSLKTVGIESLKNRRIGELSGGELQRVFIAKSLVKDPLLLILDEPVTSVDAESQKKFYELIKKINQENQITIVWSSHDLDAISKYASRVACMNKKLFFHGEKEEFFSNKDLLRTYTESSMQMHMHNHDMH
ncbi:metal ABC transporter ATP-binding protein [Nitrosopumilus sp.]|uniref:metal ABC transporter ATP-binding protein n=1 Tax=Nitrosopumilus sp. TaxID=2024843 RepID=UPI002609600C|nr:metal ABC transporter ATP-binding protein [Nitrosopumilus sp.]